MLENEEGTSCVLGKLQLGFFLPYILSSVYLCAGSGTGGSESVSLLDTTALGVDMVCPDVLMLHETS